jgi:hypothetical protein
MGGAELMDLDYIFNTPAREDWRLFTGMALMIMGLALFSVYRGFNARVVASGLSAATVGLVLLVWAGL